MKHFFLLAFSVFTIFSCRNNAVEEIIAAPPAPTAGAATTLLAYSDSAQIFTTDLTGGNRRLAVAPETNTVNEYVGNVQFNATATKFIYQHTKSGIPTISTIKSCNIDGTNKTVLKTFNVATTSCTFLKVLASGKILFGTTTFGGAGTATNIYVMNEDGTGETTFTQPGFSVSNARNTSVSKSGLDILLISASTPQPGTNYSGRMISYLGWNTAGVLTGERVIENSTDVFNDASKAGNITISNDGSLVAFAVNIGNGKFDIYTKSTAAGAAARKLIYTITVPADIPLYSTNSLKLRWLNGTDKLLAYLGKFTSPNGAAADYTQCYLITIGATSSTDVNWKFVGDDIYDITPNF